MQGMLGSALAVRLQDVLGVHESIPRTVRGRDVQARAHSRGVTRHGWLVLSVFGSRTTETEGGITMPESKRGYGSRPPASVKKPDILPPPPPTDLTYAVLSPSRVAMACLLARLIKDRGWM